MGFCLLKCAEGMKKHSCHIMCVVWHHYSKFSSLLPLALFRPWGQQSFPESSYLPCLYNVGCLIRQVLYYCIKHSKWTIFWKSRHPHSVLMKQWLAFCCKLQHQMQCMCTNQLLCMCTVYWPISCSVCVQYIDQSAVLYVYSILTNQVLR